MKKLFLGSDILEDLEEVRGEEKWVSAFWRGEVVGYLENGFLCFGFICFADTILFFHNLLALFLHF